ncbi:MAG: hypothetical protein C0433_19490 [Cyclobacterium sp.]|nr:hypothetical protein [Cyclobacterium sp.]
MDKFQNSLDVELWLNKDLIHRQNLLKTQFTSVLEDVGNSFPKEIFDKISAKSKGTKISKGNDLLGFPYLVLDLIRDFDPITGSNIRLLNWFGNGLFITILLGSNRENPVKEFIGLEFSFGLSENQWDYPDLILNRNLTTDEGKIAKAKLGFYHWIKPIPVDPDLLVLNQNLCKCLKKILGILSLPAEQVRN